MTLPRLEGMSKYWKTHPPTHVLVAAYLGVGKSEEKPKLSEQEQAEQLLSMFPMR